ncbi:Hvo_1808 family surface protein [Halosolutus halophilus]|uniref:Hvo_1808 family surface protein n=1 Tax=Halosolutus halophilus TaxID=1552990 RepID=UPI0022351158|nr:Hvo_1808 family surface protein [Halosolutus halophilus]
MGRARLFAIVALVTLSGCTLPGTPQQFDPNRELGHVRGYAHDDTFAFDGNEALTERQLEAVKYRSMARIEVVRGLRFDRDVELEVIGRDEYREQREGSEPASQFDNELWRGAFVVDGETDVHDALDDLYGDSVQGYYVNDRIVIVTDDPDEIRIDRRTLVHELVHALQDQHFGLERSGETVDERRAELGLIEGEANYVPHLYDERCGEEWQCLADRERASSEPRSFNLGLFLSIYAPYSEGPPFVAHLHETGGWDRVDRAHDARPASTSQLLSPETYPDVEPADVAIEDRSSGDWDPVTDEDGEIEADTIGEATLFATLWANGVVDRSSLTAGATALSPYNYSAPATDGWTGDTFRVYADGNDRTGHVWSLAWESEADAEAFADAYRDLLAANGARQVDDGVYRIDDGDPFAGAYRATVTGERVTIVGAPTVPELDEIHADGTASNETRAEIGATTASIAPATASSRSATAPSAIGA